MYEAREDRCAEEAVLLPLSSLVDPQVLLSHFNEMPLSKQRRMVLLQVSPEMQGRSAAYFDALRELLYFTTRSHKGEEEKAMRGS